MSLIHALEQRSTRRDAPILHWEVERPLTTDARHQVIRAFVPDRPWRDENWGGGSQHSHSQVNQCTIGRDNVAEFPALANVVDQLLSRQTFETIQGMLGQKIGEAYLRIQLFREMGLLARAVEQSDRGEFMTALLFVNPEIESQRFGVRRRDGSYEADHESLASNDTGLLFNPAKGVWQALDLERRSEGCFAVHISYVARETDWKLPARSLIRVA